MPEPTVATGSALLVDRLRAEAHARGFTMSCDDLTGGLLRSLAASKPRGRLLELGTGVGVGSAYLLEGMSDSATLATVDIDPELTAIASRGLAHDGRIGIFTEDATSFLERNRDQRYDLIFADTWAGKLDQPELALDLLAPGGIYIADDMEGMHSPPLDVPGVSREVQQRIPEQWRRLLAVIESRAQELTSTVLDWSTGILICTRRSN